MQVTVFIVSFHLLDKIGVVSFVADSSRCLNVLLSCCALVTLVGKSTLINAFLGNELMPVNNVPETARISRITHACSATCPEPLLEFTMASSPSRTSSLTSSSSECSRSSSISISGSGGKAGDGDSISSPAAGARVVTVRGAAAIKEQLQQLNRDVRGREHLRSDEQVIVQQLVAVPGPCWPLGVGHPTAHLSHHRQIFCSTAAAMACQAKDRLSKNLLPRPSIGGYSCFAVLHQQALVNLPLPVIWQHVLQQAAAGNAMSVREADLAAG
jgi:hypothetical protein